MNFFTTNRHTALAAAIMLSMAFNAAAEAPAGYYDRAEGLNKGALLEALEEIVGDHTNVGYSGVWEVFKESDVRDDGTIWDMYSTSSYRPGRDQCGNYSGVGDCYNREHSMPKSWFDDQQPMYSDAFHLYPTDGWVNGRRGNYPFGECANGSLSASGGSVQPLGRLGNSTFPGYSGTVFEPDDEYKGDFARTYFYMAAAYNSLIDDWNSPQLAGNSYPCFSSWSVNLLMKWHRQDPVSEKEINRNEVIYRWQHNRNPFIDHPELAEYVWGDNQNDGWTPGGGNTDPVIVQPAQDELFDLGITSVGQPLTTQITIDGNNLTQDLTVTMTGDDGFTKSLTSISASDANAGTSLTVRFVSQQAGSYSATVELSSSEVGQLTFDVQAEVVDGIPALPATNITQNSFTANWKCIDNSNTNYSLSVFDANDALLAGYPVQVPAGNESYNVTGLDYNTTYHYSLTGGNSQSASNVIYVTTADVEHVLGLDPSSIPSFSAVPGSPSSEQQVTAYTDNIYEPITATVTGNFEMSLDRSNWASQLTLDPDGETFYLRMKATANEGAYTGVLSMTSGEYESPDLDLSGTVAALRTFFEDFEWSEYPGSYWSGTFDGNACRWNITSMYLATSDNNQNDGASARLRDGSLVMAEDKTGGAGTFSFYGGAFNNDENSNVVVSYSTNGGSTWNELQTVTLSKNNWREYSIPVNRVGNIRFRLQQEGGDRINIDDIAITNYTSSVSSPVEDENGWDAYASAPGELTLTATEAVQIEVYSVDAKQTFGGIVTGSHTLSLDKGIYIVVSGNASKKVIVK